MINTFLQWFDETRLWKWISSKIIAHLTFRIFGYPNYDFDGWFGLRATCQELLKSQTKVYAFVAADRLSLASILVRAIARNKDSVRYSHAGWIVVDESGEPFAVHMKGEGNITEWLPAVLKECDDFALIEIDCKTPFDKAQVRARIEYYRHAPKGSVKYDFEQELEDQASPLEVNDLYCSELVWLCCKGVVPLKTSKSLGRVVFSPNDVAASGRVAYQYWSK